MVETGGRDGLQLAGPRVQPKQHAAAAAGDPEGLLVQLRQEIGHPVVAGDRPARRQRRAASLTAAIVCQSAHGRGILVSD